MGFRWGTLSENPWAAPNGILPSLLLLVVTISFAAATLKFVYLEAWSLVCFMEPMLKDLSLLLGPLHIIA
ncbi:hypothetical protein Goarm_017699 [Gossypium armourianum]|uniref:Uncharacterized protein n=1 Tax=Gossypium armourianum TaxID=34283 RepID=A0A7J9JG46_9ROSI|nr:hypothetical protein [Gossypium armourianum]